VTQCLGFVSPWATAATFSMSKCVLFLSLERDKRERESACVSDTVIGITYKGHGDTPPTFFLCSTSSCGN